MGVWLGHFCDTTASQGILIYLNITCILQQRARLLDNTERLAKTSDTLDEGYRIAKETESIGLDIIDNLQNDRDTLNRIRGRVSQYVEFDGIKMSSLFFKSMAFSKFFVQTGMLF